MEIYIFLTFSSSKRLYVFKNITINDLFMPNIAEKFLVELRFVGKVEGRKKPSFLSHFRFCCTKK